jgi:ribosomal protein L37E
MPQNNPNGKTPRQDLPEELHFDRSQVICRRCKRAFANFVIEEIDDLAQLRCGDALIAQVKMVCLHCGWTFSWDVSAKKLEAMAIRYGEIIVTIKGYNPE